MRDASGGTEPGAVAVGGTQANERDAFSPGGPCLHGGGDNKTDAQTSLLTTVHSMKEKQEV